MRKAMSRPRVVLVGDSVLDSGIWISHAHRDAAYFLRRHHGFDTDDYSTDGNRIVDVLPTTGAARRAFVWHRRIHNLPPYRDVPLEELPPSDVTVLSLGGNDLLHCLRRVRLTADAILRDLRERGVRERYERIVELLARREGTLVLVVPYVPNQRSPVGWALGGLVRKLMPELVPTWYYETAARHGATVVDLSLDFNPYDDQLYGCTSIEPSAAGSARIAALIARAAGDDDAHIDTPLPLPPPPSAPPSSTPSYATQLDEHLARFPERRPIPLARRVWKLQRTLYFQALLMPVSVYSIVYLLLMTRYIDDHQKEQGQAEGESRR